jgi:hypothetical protein
MSYFANQEQGTFTYFVGVLAQDIPEQLREGFVR